MATQPTHPVAYKPTTVNPCFISEAERMLPYYAAASRSVIMLAPPGTGKSMLMQQTSVTWNETLISLNVHETFTNLKVDATPKELVADIRLLIEDYATVAGIMIPDVATRKSIRTRPAILPESDSPVVVIFLDEITSAPKLVQGVCYQLLYDRRLGEWPLPAYMAVVAAGNYSTDRSVTTELPLAIWGRVARIDLENRFSDWSRWAVGAGIRPEVISYLSYVSSEGSGSDTDIMRDRLCAFDPCFTVSPTPRGWQFVSEQLEAGMPSGLELKMLSGLIGRPDATQFLGFLAIQDDLPPRDSIILDPYTAAVPTSPAARWVLVGALASIATRENFGSCLTYIERFRQREFLRLFVVMASGHNADCVNSSSYTQWASRPENRALLSA